VPNLAQKMVLVALLLSGGNAFAQANPQLKVSCGPDSAITAHSTLDQLVVKFGRGNVRKQQVEIGEGETREGIVIFPGVSDKEIAVLPSTTNEPMYVVLRGQRSQWVTAGGITLGSGLKELEQLNGKPFLLTGFDWDYSGTVVDWQGGKLQPSEGCVFQPRLDYGSRDGSSEEENKAAVQVIGDRDYSSSLPAMQALNPKVYEIVITFYK
jgi:hypothetical protein